MAIKVREAATEDYEAICSLFTELDAYHLELDPETFQAFDGPARPLERVKSAKTPIPGKELKTNSKKGGKRVVLVNDALMQTLGALF